MGRTILAILVALAIQPASAIVSVNTGELTPADQLAEDFGLPFLNPSEVEEEALLLDMAEIDGAEKGLSSEEAIAEYYRRGGWGHHRRGKFVCYSQNRRGHVFQARGFRPRVVQSRATSKCYRQSSKRPGRGKWGRRGPKRVRCFDMGCDFIGRRGPKHRRPRGPVYTPRQPRYEEPVKRGGGKKGGGRRK